MCERNKFDICLLEDILQSLNVPNYKDYATFIYINNNFGHFEKMCQNSIHKCQYGGGIVNVIFEGVDFEFSKYRDDEYSMFALNAKNNVNCLLIRINKGEKSAEILGIGYYPFCFTNKQIKHFKGKTNGSLLLKLALKLVNDVKEHYNLKKITIQDNSQKKCHDFNIDLSKMYILMHGETWYGNHGFIPYDSANKIEHKFGIKMYKQNKEIMNKITVKEIPQLKKYIINSYNNIVTDNNHTNFYNLLLQKEEIVEMYNKYKNRGKLLKDLIKNFLIKYDKSCLLFYSFYEQLFNDINLYDFHGKYYTKFIE
ncbi:hypothetical protein BMW23_1131 [Bodo saltans virus]|uniref:Uncharacterized protein n=1 Tax=Bodo saltans virus TaxID=2024608 RepID=A0A2H4UW99_9VIRU|nr:hypothetical protein QJ851_gp1111 [Bodo saltans virus]ATZ81174.1 hypothetical protein BMW23_1131 [Bodo saltans virus]